MSARFFVSLLPLLAPLVVAETATFTHYGSGDSTGSQNCANPPADRPLACGAGTTNVQGYTAAISQNAYGAGPGAGAGPGCGECWTLTINADYNGNAIAPKTINITVNNLCPAQGNTEWCDIPNGGTNQHGGQVHFDICSDNGGSNALFAGGNGAGKGTATQIDCGTGTAAESSAAASSSSAQPTSPASSAPASPSSAAPSVTSSASGASGQGSPASGSEGSGSSGSEGPAGPASGGSKGASSAAAGAHTSLPHYQPSLFSHSIPSFPSVTAGGAHGHHSPHATPTPGLGHHHGSGEHGHLSGAPYVHPSGVQNGAQGGALPSQSVTAAAAQGSQPAGGSGGEEECEDGPN